MTDVPSYLSRVGYKGSTSPTLETLRAIHYAHLLTVPFENLDIALGRKIALDQDSFIRKIAELRRGGFCYELNGAFAALLQALGFRVTLLSARVARRDGGESPEFDHLTLRVDLDETWLADVGFGESFLEPLRIKPALSRWTARDVPHRRAWRAPATGKETTGRHLERPVLIYFPVAPAGRVCRHVRVPSTVSRLAFHAE